MNKDNKIIIAVSFTILCLLTIYLWNSSRATKPGLKSSVHPSRTTLTEETIQEAYPNSKPIKRTMESKQNSTPDVSTTTLNETSLSLHTMFLEREISLDYADFKDWLKGHQLAFNETIAGSPLSGERVELSFQIPNQTGKWLVTYDIFPEGHEFKAISHRSTYDLAEGDRKYREALNTIPLDSQDKVSFRSQPNEGLITWAKLKKSLEEAEIIMTTEVYMDHVH